MSNRAKLDSNLVDKDIIIEQKDVQLQKQGEKITTCVELSSQQRKQIKKLERRNKWLKVAIGVSAGVVLTELIIILAK